jgi:hypothetical protein
MTESFRVPNYGHFRDLHRQELQARIYAKGLVRYARLPTSVLELLFSEIDRLGPLLRSGYGVGVGAEEVIEFSEKLRRGSPRPLRFSFEAPVEDEPSAERLVSFVNDLGDLCGLCLSAADGIVRHAALSRRSFGQHSTFVVWFAFSFQEDLPVYCKMYFNLNDRDLRDSADRLKQILTLTERGSLFLPVLMVLSVATERRVSLRGAAITFPGCTRLKLYFEVSRDFEPGTMLSLCEQANLFDLNALGSSGMRELFMQAGRILSNSDTLTWGLSVEYDGPPTIGAAVSRADIYFRPPQTSTDQLITWLNTFMPEPWKTLWRDQSRDGGREYAGLVSSDGAFFRTLGYVALGWDATDTEEINLYWTLRRSWAPEPVLTRARFSLLADVDQALADGLVFILAHQSEQGSWIDWNLPPGAASLWTTAYIGYRFRLLNGRFRQMVKGAVALAAEWLLASEFAGGGWGYNDQLPPDADSTALAIAFLSTEQARVPDRAYKQLKLFQRVDGGFATYSEDFGSWGVSHPDVTPMAVMALLSHYPRGDQSVESGIRYALSQATADGLWRSFWWTSALYSTEVNISLAKQAGIQRDWTRTGSSLNSLSPANAFEFSLFISALLDIGHDPECESIYGATQRLLREQTRDGSWISEPILRVTRQDCFEPWNESVPGPTFSDPNRLFTSATVIGALSKLRRAYEERN